MTADLLFFSPLFCTIVLAMEEGGDHTTEVPFFGRIRSLSVERINSSS